MTVLTRRRRRLVRHYLEMLVAMLAGMVVVGTARQALLGAPEGVETATLLMATDMTVGMAAWMRVRRHRWRPIAEMSATMYLPFVIGFPPFWLGLLSADGLTLWGHLLMLPAMAAAMALRPNEYAGPHENPGSAP